MGKVYITIKSVYERSLIFLLGLTVAVCSCSRIKEPYTVLPYKVAAGQSLGTVSVSVYNTLGLKNEQSIARELALEARELYPGGSAIANVRYDKHIAYADVIK